MNAIGKIIKLLFVTVPLFLGITLSYALHGFGLGDMKETYSAVIKESVESNYVFEDRILAISQKKYIEEQIRKEGE